MLVFWWTGKGYLTPIILIVVLAIFGVVLQAGRPIISDAPWFWGIAFIFAAAVNWRVGRKHNRKKLAAVRSIRFRDKLVYPARNKFMSLPFEAWSIPLAVGGACAIGYSIVA